MALPKVYVTQKIQDAGLSLLQGRVDYRLWDSPIPPSRKTVLEEISAVDGLLATLIVRLDEELLEAGKNLKIISLYAVGYDSVDLAAATRRGIMVTNTPGVLTDATADTAFLLMLMAARRAIEADCILRAGEWKYWSPDFMVGADLTGATLGIVGLGQIGQAMARRALGFGMKVIYCSRTRMPEMETSLGVRYCEFDELLSSSDFVSLHCPLTPQTKNVIGERELRLMKPTAILINTARGGVVDQAALYRACSEGWIKGAGLDVFEKEPVPPEDPVLTLKNITTLPHIGSATLNARNGMARTVAQNLLDGLEGRRPANLVNPEVWRG